MVGVEPPFLYDPPARYSFSGPSSPTSGRPFDPKAVSRASLATSTTASARPRRDGPLVDFNKHPDTYVFVPSATNAVPMSRSTKTKVKYGIILLLLLRSCALIGAMGLLACMIFVTKVSGSTSWIIRAAPGIGILLNVYSIYHLSRSPTTRPPASSASYYVFATMIDSGLIAFMVFTAILVRTEEETNEYGWGTLLKTTVAKEKILLSAFLTSVTNGGLHFVMGVISVCMAVIFRQISHLPPDMNPLEDNLTAQPQHKRNRSSIPSSSSQAHLSMSTLGEFDPAKRMSQSSDPLISPTRTLHFLHTRTDSTSSLQEQWKNRPVPVSPTNKTAIPELQHLSSFSTEVKHDVPSPREPRQRQGHMYQNSNASTPSMSPTRKPRDLIAQASPSADSKGETSRTSLLRDNWFAYGDPSPEPGPTEKPNAMNQPGSPVSRASTYDEAEQESIYSDLVDWSQSVTRPDSRAPNLNLGKNYGPGHARNHTLTQSRPIYDFERDIGDGDSDKSSETSAYEMRVQPQKHMINPLELNPPTPARTPAGDAGDEAAQEPRRVALSDNPNLANTASLKPEPLRTSRPNSIVSSSNTSPTKTRSYGNLALSGESFRKAIQRQYETVNMDEHDHRSDSESEDDGDDENRYYGNGVSRYVDAGRGSGASTPRLAPSARGDDRKGRVVSQTGVDIGESGMLGAGLLNGFGLLGGQRRRDVSGKVAEEGRGMLSESNAREERREREKEDWGRNVRKTGGESPPPKKLVENGKPGAAGWARWAGL